MILSEKRFSEIINIFIVLIISTIFFRVLCTWIMILFVVFNLFFFKRLHFTKKAFILILCISSPFLLELLFFWNNSSLYEGLKTAEKTVSLLLLPLCIIGNRNRINLYKIIDSYVFTTLTLMLILFVGFMIISPKFFDVYLKGQELWEVGYEFAKSFGMHAPVLNMHLAFIAVCCFWFVLNSLKNKNNVKLIFNVLLGLLSFFFVLFVNTRMALGTTLVGVAIVFFYEVIIKYNLYKTILIFLVSITIGLGTFYLYIQKNPYMKVKYFDVTLVHMDKINKLDLIEKPEVEVFNSLVTRLSIWNSSWELSKKNLLLGVGSADSKNELFEYYRQTNQMFLYKYKFPVHNQFLDSTLRFGIFGFLGVLLYLLTIGYIGFVKKNSIILGLFLIFTLSNLTDDFLILFHGIVFSGFWASIFACYYLENDKSSL
ncbi:O-antigen ligase family protein [Mariniflexile sp. AS56]|uniref:O-antigen ligase family protein n=1 Tax=Mariniflexile sp. AS56 TaxID=3063957 RepID=UPI0026EC5014|nr:O-antigen ligase family protein [Mariniflexile sp. AS56]MDO7172159.1 O-antigen ligase family protein [Mariniflexile sp. AS56]